MIRRERRQSEKSMEVLIDTNVIIDYITKRISSPDLDASVRTVTLCGDEEIDGYVAFHSIPNIWFTLRSKSEDLRREWLKNICQLLTVAGASHENVIAAIENQDFKDFEDCLQDECAQTVKADYIVTWNIKDFDCAKTKVITPKEFVQLYSEDSLLDNEEQ